MEQKIVQLVPDENLEKEFQARGELATWPDIAARDLNRLYALYKVALADAAFTVEEAILICEVLNEAELDYDSATNMGTTVAEVCLRTNRHRDWDIEDYQPLVEKLQSCSKLQCLAILDAADQFWISSDYGAEGIYGVARRLFSCAEWQCPYGA